MEKAIYQILGYVNIESRPNIEVLFEDEDLELVNEVYDFLNKGEYSHKEKITASYKYGVNIDYIEDMNVLGIYKSTHITGVRRC